MQSCTLIWKELASPTEWQIARFPDHWYLLPLITSLYCLPNVSDIFHTKFLTSNNSPNLFYRSLNIAYTKTVYFFFTEPAGRDAVWVCKIKSSLEINGARAILIAPFWRNEVTGWNFHSSLHTFQVEEEWAEVGALLASTELTLAWFGTSAVYLVLTNEN